MKFFILFAIGSVLSTSVFSAPAAKIVINDLKAISNLYSSNLDMYRGEAVKGDVMKSYCKGFVIDLAEQYSSDAQEGIEYDLHIDKSVTYNGILKDVKFSVQGDDGFIKVGFFCMGVEDKDLKDLELLQVNFGNIITVK